MARSKKAAATLTPEEKLQQALVPVQEQPYEVPENWCWTRMQDIADLYNGDRGKNYPSKKDYQVTGIPFINAGALVEGQLDSREFNFITEDKYNALSAGKIQYGDILYCLRGSLGKTAIVETEEKGAISSSLCILRCNQAINKNYLFYLLNSDVIRRQQDNAENGSAQPNLSAASVTKYMIPLPAMLEQQRIVERIESIFAKLDEAKEKAQSVVDGFELRKSAILHKAFTGELTAQWRQEHEGSEDGWTTVNIGDVFEVFSGKGFKEKEYSTSGTKLLRISNVTYDALVWDDTKYLPDNYVEMVPELVLKPNDIVMALNRPITNGKLKVSVVDDSETYILYQRVGCLRNKKPDDVKTEFLRYALLSKDFLDQVEKNLQGSDQPYINLPPLKKLTINICSVGEQTEVARILENLISKEIQAKDTAEAVIDQIDTMKKAVLARAFRGELGTNDPSEESALELLKSIL